MSLIALFYIACTISWRRPKPLLFTSLPLSSMDSPAASSQLQHSWFPSATSPSRFNPVTPKPERLGPLPYRSPSPRVTTSPQHSYPRQAPPLPHDITSVPPPSQHRCTRGPTLFSHLHTRQGGPPSPPIFQPSGRSRLPDPIMTPP